MREAIDAAPRTAWSEWFARPWGELAVSFDPDRPDCVASVAFHHRAR